MILSQSNALNYRKIAGYYRNIPQKRKGDRYGKGRLYQLNHFVDSVITNDRLPLIHFTIPHFIEEHFSEDITLSDLSASANISKSECSRCFKISLNTTPYKYLEEYRLSKASELLRETVEPVGNIATAVGFHQMSHFGKCFKEI